MSVSKTSLQNYAKILTEHDAAEHLQELVDKRLFDRFRTATNEERKIITDIMEAKDLFFSEIRYIAAGIDDDTAINDEQPKP